MNGEKLMERLGEERVAVFCDNYKAGMTLHGKKVIDFGITGYVPRGYI